MVDLGGKGLTKEVMVNKFNISGVSEAVIKQDLDYIMHVEFEVPMEYFTKLEEMKEAIVHNLVIHADAAVRRSMYDLGATVAEQLRDSVAETVKNSLPETRELVTVEASHDLSDLMGSE